MYLGLEKVIIKTKIPNVETYLCRTSLEQQGDVLPVDDEEHAGVRCLHAAALMVST